MQVAPGKEEHWAQRVEVNSKDGYSKGVIDYAIRWADLMESKVGTHTSIADIAKETSHEADTDGITGFMYGAAVHELSESWVHGKALRRWHNGEYGVEDESGTVNPAILTIKE